MKETNKNVIDYTNEEFQKLVAESDTDILENSLIPFLEKYYQGICIHKDAVIEGVKRGTITKDAGVSATSDLYSILFKIEDRILYIREQLKER